MKNLIIVGANSYIGNSFKEYFKNNEYNITEIDSLITPVKDMDFSGADCVLHLAGIAHISSKIPAEDYFKVNRDLAISVAEKAKKDGTKQFIFMSSMIIYGENEKIGKIDIITEKTMPNPKNAYGKSKLEADLHIQKLNSENFKTVVIRTPMVYGKGCKGNFPKLVKMALKIPIFPNIKNQRSMIYIKNLCEFIKLIIINNESGLFYPQNKDYISTLDIIKTVRQHHNKKTLLIKIFNPIIYLLAKVNTNINKLFGNKVYDKEISNYFDNKYQIVDNKESIIRSDY